MFVQITMRLEAVQFSILASANQDAVKPRRKICAEIEVPLSLSRVEYK